MISFLSISGMNIFRVSDDHMNPICFQMVIDKDSVFTSRFHADIVIVKCMKPINKFNKITMISGKLKKMIDRFVCDLMSNNDAAGQFAFVDIDTTTDRIHDSTYRKSSFQEKKGSIDCFLCYLVFSRRYERNHNDKCTSSKGTKFCAWAGNDTVNFKDLKYFNQYSRLHVFCSILPFQIKFTIYQKGSDILIQICACAKH